MLGKISFKHLYLDGLIESTGSRMRRAGTGVQMPSRWRPYHGLDVVLVPSLNLPNQVQVSGLEHADYLALLFKALDRGTDFERTVVGDVEPELYRVRGAEVRCLLYDEQTAEAEKATEAL